LGIYRPGKGYITPTDEASKILTVELAQKKLWRIAKQRKRTIDGELRMVSKAFALPISGDKKTARKRMELLFERLVPKHFVDSQSGHQY
jgi:hypothetical protein